MREVGWVPRVVVTDVFDWLQARDDTHWDVVVANLFVHHFAADELQRLLTGIASRTSLFVCCNPGVRRRRWREAICSACWAQAR